MLFSACCGFALDCLLLVCSCLPVVGYALVLPAVGHALVLPAVGYALSVLLIFPCCWVCSSFGPCTRVAFFLLLTTGSLAVVPSLIPLTTGSLAVVPFLIPPASLCGSLRLRGSLLAPSTPLLSIKPLRDCCFAVDALVPRTGSLQQRVLLTMRTGFSFVRYFSFTCSAEMSVPLFTGCVHPHKGFHRGLGLGTTVAYQISCSFCLVCSPASLCHCLRKWSEVLNDGCDLRRSFFLCCCVSCAVVQLSLLHGCAGVPTSLNSVATSFEASCERLPCGTPSTECFVWSLHASFLSHARLSSARDRQHYMAIALLLRWNQP